MKLMGNFDALFFDCDGVIAETERDAHRVTFNSAFKEKGLTTEWDVELYGELLKIGGGKERMTAHFNKVGWPSSVPEADRSKFVQELHLSKTAKFQAAVESGIVPLRPGGKRQTFVTC
jgi:beta-phosphoglucomutase-like phosphatase (HAD superfamily)